MAGGRGRRKRVQQVDDLRTRIERLEEQVDAIKKDMVALGEGVTTIAQAVTTLTEAIQLMPKSITTRELRIITDDGRIVSVFGPGTIQLWHPEGKGPLGVLLQTLDGRGELTLIDSVMETTKKITA